MLHWHLEPIPGHAAILARGYPPGSGYAQRSDYAAVCTILRKDADHADAVGMLSVVPIERGDREALGAALAAEGIKVLHSERGGRWVAWDTSTGRRLDKDEA